MSTCTAGSTKAGVVALTLHRAAQRGQVSQQRNAGGVVEDDAPDNKWDLRRAFALGLPLREGADVFFKYPRVVAVAHQRFEHDAQADRQT